VTEVNVKGKIWYRVRVGQYGTREEAKKVEEVLKTKENYTKSFIASR
jgi:cell division protein FtsN